MYAQAKAHSSLARSEDEECALRIKKLNKKNERGEGWLTIELTSLLII